MERHEPRSAARYVMRVALPAVAGLLLAACSSVPDITEVKMPKLNLDLASSDWNVFAKDSPASLKPVAAQELVDGAGRCAAMAEPAAQSANEPAPKADSTAPVETPLPRNVALGMDECEVVRSAGQPQKVDIAANERGDRTLIMTYQSSERSAVYRFVAGRLVSMERGPEPEKPVKPHKGRAKKPVAKKLPAKKPPSA